MKTIRVRMLTTQTGRHPEWTASGTFHCRKGAAYDVPHGLAEAWMSADPPVAESVAGSDVPSPVVVTAPPVAEPEPEPEPEIGDE